MRYISWPVKNRTELNLLNGGFEVDIGMLATTQHENAFKDLFNDVLSINGEILGKVQSIHAHSHEVKSVDLSLNPHQLAQTLYSMNLPEVVLGFSGPEGIKMLTVRFDNPSFSLQ